MANSERYLYRRESRKDPLDLESTLPPKRGVSGKERFNTASALGAEPGSLAPPAPATGNAHSQIGQRADAMLI